MRTHEGNPRLSSAPPSESQDAFRTHVSEVAVDASRAVRASRWRFWPLAIPALGLLELALHVYFARRAPRAEEWADVRPAVAAWYAPEKVVVVAPQWAEPIARWKLGDALMPMRDVARPDVTRYPQVLEVSALGQRSPELIGWSVRRETKHGRFVIRELQNPSPVRLTYDFTDHVLAGQAEVRVEQPSVTACAFTNAATVESGGLGAAPTYPASRFACPGQPAHVFVGLTVIEDGAFRPRRCIWSHPPNGGALVTRFKGVPLGEVIHGHAGMGYLYERDKANPPFVIRVVIDGAEVGRMVHVDGDFWKSFEVPLGAHAHGTRDVEFHVTALPSATHVCFEADSR
jgi:hypothetical protein